mmetsp:Transcript_18298/g.51248  ORF Transcript_18298/g.51248 Transcript_18298/m.51248 type:complete len:419 (+) Transcript_18298:356-1612(+)|eukprot:CAMPEP_0117661600 /NCGR_PEP_ID=MMETSP0804-20121206/7622_1 /TAXON_ID=1074897 /ORGANISM="Tetraselmis astigmatica, Strain CCMP880" /LENGTH=418 /DNA_ID=CAMNT_0005468475 /DNA_START=447 /DNA_END=1703 /DNA_ORIENTATION=+
MFGRRRSEAAQSSPVVNSTADSVVPVEVITTGTMPMVEANGTVRAHDPADPPKAPPRGHAGGTPTPRSISSVGTTASRLCNYLEEAITKLSITTEHIESAGRQFEVQELDRMLKEVLSEVQRVVLRSGNLDKVQLDMVLFEVQQLLDAIDDNLEEEMKDQLRGQISRLARQAERLTGSLSQVPMVRSASSGALAITSVAAEKTVDKSREKELVSMIQEQREQFNAQKQSMMEYFRMMQQTMAQRSMQVHTGSPYHGAQIHGVQHPDAFPQHSQAPITIHNHVGVEQTADARADQRMENHMWSTVSAKLKQAMKHLGSGPWPLILAGAGGLLFREFGGRFLLKNSPGQPTNKKTLLAMKRLKIERRAMAKEAMQQLHACERAFHEVKEQSMKPFRNPLHQPRTECHPDYTAFDPSSDTE